MIISAGERTDIPTFYSEWFLNRLKAGFVLVRNPMFPNKITKYSLDPTVVDCLVLCSKNPAPMVDKIKAIQDMGHMLYFFVTITPYGKDIEPHVPPYEEVIATFKQLSKLLGPNNVCWRYDPILVNETYTVDYHKEVFEAMAIELGPYTNRCIVSFVYLYQKLRKNFPELTLVSELDSRELLTYFSSIASREQFSLQVCADRRDYTELGMENSGCFQARHLELALGQPIKALPEKPLRDGCHCIPRYDIGAYESCPHGCRYCYAVNDATQALANYKQHDPLSSLLLGQVLPTDEIKEAQQKSYKLPFSQESLF